MHRARLVLLALLCAGLLAWGIERLIVTDREAVTALLEGAARSLERGDDAGLRSAFADDFRSESPAKDRGAFVAWLLERWRETQASGVSVEVRECEVEGDVARVRARAVAAPYAAYPVEARLECVRTADGWRVARLVDWSFGSLAR